MVIMNSNCNNQNSDTAVASREESMWVEHIQDGQEKEARQEEEEEPEKAVEKKSGFTLPSYGEALWLCYLRNRDDNEEEDEEREDTPGRNAAPKEGYADTGSSTRQCSPKRLLVENNTPIHGPPRAKRSRRNSVVAWRR